MNNIDTVYQENRALEKEIERLRGRVEELKQWREEDADTIATMTREIVDEALHHHTCHGDGWVIGGGDE